MLAATRPSSYRNVPGLLASTVKNLRGFPRAMLNVSRPRVCRNLAGRSLRAMQSAGQMQISHVSRKCEP